MQLFFRAAFRSWFPLCFTLAALGSRPASAQPRPDEPPVNYEIQINNESFVVEGNQPPIKVEMQAEAEAPCTNWRCGWRQSSRWC